MKKRRLIPKGNTLRWEDSIKIFLAIGFTSIAAYADIPTGLIGGVTNSSDAYSSFITSNGTLIPIPNLPIGGLINGVSLSDTGLGLIGGEDGSPSGYAAFVSLDGTVNTLNLNLPMGIISSTAINHSGNGLIGGNDGSSAAYAALVSQDGTITVLPTLTSGFIHSTALNDDGVGLIGGEGGTFPYAAYVTSSGTLTQVNTSPLEGGHLVVAINDLGNGIVGGFSTFGAYAGLVTPGGGAPTQLSPIPGIGGIINTVAINNSGVGLIGGYDESGNMYAGYSTSEGTVTPLLGSSISGQIMSVAINTSGTGLIGGVVNSAELYAALVQPNGTINSLIPGSIPGVIKSVALNDAGVGLIGGQNNSLGYAALIAPNGTLTLLDMSNEITISSVALIPNEATPQSIGPHLSGFYTQLSAAATLQSRFIEKNKLWNKGKSSQGEMAYNEVSLSGKKSTIFSTENDSAKAKKQNTIWIAPFGNYVKLKTEGSIPSYTNEIGGVLAAYDHQSSNYLVGASLGYAFNYIDYSQHLGHSKIQEEMVCLYGAYYQDHFWFDGALWGGLYQLSNVRHTLSIITSKASTHGWIFSPHIEMASPWDIDKKERYFVEPFFMLDWVNNWQNHFTETGAAGFNLQMGNLYSSLLQSEVGLRFYERFEYAWGNFCLEEKLSYVNQAPFHVNSARTSFAGSASTFPIAVGSSQVENLGSAQLIGSFIPRNPSYPFGGFTIQVTANENYQSYFASLYTGMDF